MIEEHCKENVESFNEIRDRIAHQKILGEETFAGMDAIKKDIFDVRHEVANVKSDLDEHREAERKDHSENAFILKAIEKKVDKMMPTVEQVQAIENAGIIGKKIISGIVWLIVVSGVIFGAVIGVKEWFKR